MKIKRKSDNKIFNNIVDAIDGFKCPGPCDPDCPLYEAMPLHNGHFVHKCHPDYYMLHQKEVLSLIGCELVPPGTTFIAVVKPSAVRDVQICTKSDTDPTCDLEDDWYDMDDAEVYLGVFYGKDAAKQAAKFANTTEDNIRLIPVDSI